jgi:hypothetical protein
VPRENIGRLAGLETRDTADLEVNGCQAKLCCSAAAFVGPKIFLNKFRFLFSPFFKIIFKAVRSNWMLEFR